MRRMALCAICNRDSSVCFLLSVMDLGYDENSHTHNRKIRFDCTLPGAGFGPLLRAGLVLAGSAGSEVCSRPGGANSSIKPDYPGPIGCRLAHANLWRT